MSDTPTVDPTLTPVLDGLAGQGFTSFEALGLGGARAAMAGFTAFQAPGPDVAAAVDATYGPDPAHRLRILTPSGDGPLPVLLYLHGGGYIGCDLPLVEGIGRDLAVELGAVVVTAAYRKAPETRFPGPQDDAWAALQWVLAHVGEYGGDPARLAVAGDSAGGGLAAELAVRAGREGVPLAAAVLLYPFLDPWAETVSRTEFATGYVLPTSDLLWFGECIVRSEADRRDPRLVLPLTPAAELAAVPPTLVVTNELDPLRDEAEDFADQLRAAGVEVETARLTGMVHAAYWLTAVTPRSRDYHDRIVRFLAGRLTRDPAGTR